MLKCRATLEQQRSQTERRLLRPRFPKKEDFHESFIDDTFGTYPIRRFEVPANVPEEDSLSYQSQMILLCEWLHKNFAEVSGGEKRLLDADNFRERLYPQILAAIPGLTAAHVDEMLAPLRGEEQQYFENAYF